MEDANPEGGPAMTIVQKMRAQLKDAMRARDSVRLDVLRYWIAQLTLGTGEEVPDADALKKMRGVIKEAKTGQTSFSPAEIAILQEWVPASLGPEQIKAALVGVVDQIKAAPKDGMAMGLAMKALAGQAVESDDVKAAVAEIRAGA
jgi:uncharacterized protein YqeY